MPNRKTRVRGLAAAAICLVIASSSGWAAPYAGMFSATTLDLPAGSLAEPSAKEAASLYLTSPAPVADAGMARAVAAYAAVADTRRTPKTLVLHAPDDPAPIARLASYTFTDVHGLVGSDLDERSVPLGSTAMMSLNPGGFGRVMTGRPLGRMGSWAEAAETSISYIRPHVNAQMIVALEIPGTSRPTDFEGLGLQPRAYLDVEHFSRLEAADIGGTTDRFGRRVAPPPVDEPQTALAVGLDLGILPTFLSQMGLSLSLVASRGQQTGDTRVALVGTTELPVDWRPRERPIQHPTGLAVAPIESYSGQAAPYYGGGGGGGGGALGNGGGGGGGPTPITPTPPIPEPATLVLLGSAVAAALAGRRFRRR